MNGQKSLNPERDAIIDELATKCIYGRDHTNGYGSCDHLELDKIPDSLTSLLLPHIKIFDTMSAEQLLLFFEQKIDEAEHNVSATSKKYFLAVANQKAKVSQYSLMQYLTNIALSSSGLSVINEREIIKNTTKGDYKVNQRNFEELIKYVTPYIARSVYNSAKSYDEDLINTLKWHVYKLLIVHGATPMGKPFSQAFKLRIANILTNNFRNKVRRYSIAPTYTSEDPTILQEAFRESRDQFNNFTIEIETRDCVEKLITILPKREKTFVMCFIKYDGDINLVAQETGFSTCYVHRTIKNIRNIKKVKEVFENV